jgi:soluble lytic murein transglycosylase
MLTFKEIPAPALVLLALLAATTANAQGDPFAAARAEFQAAYRAAGAKPPPAAAADSTSLQEYPLYPYLVAARLENRLGDPSVAGEIEAFLSAHGNEPVARSLRRSWLMKLAERKDWARFLAAYRPDTDDTTAALCAALSARVALGRTEGLAEDISAAWLTPRSMPPVCDPAFDWLRAQDRLTPDLIERRARLALAAGEAGLARYLAKSLPEAQSGPILQWATLIERPRAAFDALIADPKRSVEPEAMLDGWRRYARADTDAAAALYPSLVQARGLDAAAASPYAIAVALPLSWSRHPRALEFFALGRVEDFDELAHEWQVRAALWAGNWTRARDGLAAMPEALRNQNRWRYWSARVAEKLGDREAASAGYAAVVPTDNWYAALAAVRTGRSYAPTPVPLATDEALLARVAAEPGMVRTHELLLSAMQSEANSEWRAALDALDRDAQVQAVRLASSWGWYLPSIAAAAKLGLFDDYELLYPRPYDDEVRRAAASTGLPPSLIYAIIRQESLYRADAASSAGALGLMQLLPSTAQATARRAGLPKPTRASLLDPSVNVPLGSAYLRRLLDRVDGELPLAIASYNAGPGAVRRWLPPTRMETDVWVENIPYNETRAYVQRVHWHSLVFDWLTDRKAKDVSSWLGQIDSFSEIDRITSTDDDQ